MLKRNTALLLFGSYLLILLYSMFFGFSRTQSPIYMYNFMPFSTVKNYIIHYEYFPFSTWIINLAGNIGVFIPFGIFLPLLFPILRNIFRFIIIFIIGITMIESIQLVSKRGSFDVDDIILNTVGALIGFIVYVGVKKKSNA
ncbi:VanZ family protein [Cytobacillus sp. S13-E01]|uniref:VanZ family protein n=1 Tax=Cytobacillus sp. S13-E01 TaxID=3031326 RepID=UPI0023D85C3B|nr:VanZ family protein [Cytobacillus sp. S13-E01]MDF0726629.1 VanZ family protein [Cytobacillus sp. S13-E01]